MNSLDTNRKTAFFTLMDVESKKSYSNIALNHHIKLSRPNSQAFVRELTYGVLENKMLLDHIIDQLASSGIEKIKTADRDTAHGHLSAQVYGFRA